MPDDELQDAIQMLYMLMSQEGMIRYDELLARLDQARQQGDSDLEMNTLEELGTRLFSIGPEQFFVPLESAQFVLY